MYGKQGALYVFLRIYAHALISITTASDCQTPSGQIPGDKPEQGINGDGRKDFEKRRV